MYNECTGFHFRFSWKLCGKTFPFVLWRNNFTNLRPKLDICNIKLWNVPRVITRRLQNDSVISGVWLEFVLSGGIQYLGCRSPCSGGLAGFGRCRGWWLPCLASGGNSCRLWRLGRSGRGSFHGFAWGLSSSA